MARFFISEVSSEGKTAVITGPDVKHIGKVLRLGPGSQVGLVDGEGREFAAKIREITNKEVICDITAENEAAVESPVDVTLYQGLPKGDKMDLIIQKSTEIGVIRIVPVICERTIVKLDKKKTAGRLTRWQRVAEEAAKQSRRTVVPEVSAPLMFPAAMKEISTDVLGIMPWEEERAVGIKSVLKKYRVFPARAAVFIGPEGGFTKEEVKTAQTAGILPVSMGPRIMRTETAGIVAVTAILYEIGDLGGVADG